MTDEPKPTDDGGPSTAVQVIAWLLFVAALQWVGRHYGWIG